MLLYYIKKVHYSTITCHHFLFQKLPMEIFIWHFKNNPNISLLSIILYKRYFAPPHIIYVQIKKSYTVIPTYCIDNNKKQKYFLPLLLIFFLCSSPMSIIPFRVHDLMIRTQHLLLFLSSGHASNEIGLLYKSRTRGNIIKYQCSL